VKRLLGSIKLDYQIAIPSYKRAEICRDKTLATLVRHKADPERITVFVANEEEYAEYTKVLPSNIKIVVGVPKLWPQRHWYNTQHYPKGTRILNLDDDISAFKMLAKDKLAEYDGTIDDLARLGFSTCEEHGARLWGIGAVENAFYMADTITVGLRYICGIVHGSYAGDTSVTNPKRSQKSSGEDFETTLRAFVDYGAVVRIDYLCPSTKYFAQGGIDAELKDSGQPDRQVDHTETLKDIVARFPDLASLKTKANGVVNIRLKPITYVKISRFDK
jgi:hypothetical protein